MASNSPISVLAGLLDFSPNSLACLAREEGSTNPSWTELAFGPRRLRHPESPVVAITQNYSYSLDAERNGKTISALLRGNSCSTLLLEDDKFPFLSSLSLSPSHFTFTSLFLSLYLIFLSVLLFVFGDFLCPCPHFTHSPSGTLYSSLCKPPLHKTVCIKTHIQYTHNFTQGSPTLKIHSQEY